MIASRYYLSFSLIFWPAGQLIFTFNIWCVANNTCINSLVLFFCMLQCSKFQIGKPGKVAKLANNWQSCCAEEEEKKGCVLCAVVLSLSYKPYDRMIYSFRVLNSYLTSQKTNFKTRKTRSVSAGVMLRKKKKGGDTRKTVTTPF